MKATVFVVDDDASVRKSLSRLLKAASYRVQTFASASEFLDASVENHPGCILLDLRMPHLDGMELQERLAAKDYHAPIIFLTGHGDVATGVRAIKKGAVDFLEKPVDDEDLLAAIEQAIARDAKNREHMSASQIVHARIRALTAREHEVLRHVIAGARNKQIADKLDISEKTVKVHRGRVMEKLRVKSIAELVQLAAKAGIPPSR